MKCTITNATASRVRRYADAEARRNHLVIHSSGANAARATSPSGTSRIIRITPTLTTDSTEVRKMSRPNSSSSLIASRSDVNREITRPDV